MNAWLIAVYGLLGLAVFEPMLGVVICGALIALQVALLVLRPATAGIPARAVADPTDQPVPKFSIHVAMGGNRICLLLASPRSSLSIRATCAAPMVRTSLTPFRFMLSSELPWHGAPPPAGFPA